MKRRFRWREYCSTLRLVIQMARSVGWFALDDQELLNALFKVL